MAWNKTRRKAVNVVMLSLTGLCTLFAAGTLVFILGYLFVHGIQSLNWNFFTKLPAPVGETGGGMANAILGVRSSCCWPPASAFRSGFWAASIWPNSAVPHSPSWCATLRTC